MGLEDHEETRASQHAAGLSCSQDAKFDLFYSVSKKTNKSNNKIILSKNKYNAFPFFSLQIPDDYFIFHFMYFQKIYLKSKQKNISRCFRLYNGDTAYCRLSIDCYNFRQS